MINLNAKAIKVAVVVDPRQIASFTVPFGATHVPITVTVSGRVLTGRLNAKTVRKAKTTIAEHGPDNVAAIVQGKLVGDEIAEAGLSAQPKGGAA